MDRARAWHAASVIAVVAATSPVVGPAAAQPGPLGRAPSRFAMFNGNRLHFKSLGAGRTAVVLVHGWASDLTAWRTQVDALAGRTRVVLIDLPGHGRSDKPPTDYSLDFFARAVGSVLETAGVEKAVLVGHSMGVPVIRRVARLHPDRTLALVAVDGALLRPDADSAAIGPMLARLRGPDYGAALEEMLIGMLGPEASAEVRSLVLQAARSTPKHVLVSAMEGMFDRAAWRPDPIPVPLLVVVAKGPSWPAAYRRSVAAIAPDLIYEEVDGVGHYLMMERPEVFNPILTRFLSNLQVLR